MSPHLSPTTPRDGSSGPTKLRLLSSLHSSSPGRDVHVGLGPTRDGGACGRGLGRLGTGHPPASSKTPLLRPFSLPETLPGVPFTPTRRRQESETTGVDPEGGPGKVGDTGTAGRTNPGYPVDTHGPVGIHR